MKCNKTKQTFLSVFLLCLLLVSAFQFLRVGVWQIKPAHATMIFNDGFETGDLTAWTAAEGGTLPTAETTYKYNGTYSMRCNPTIHDQEDVYKSGLTATAIMYEAFYVYIDGGLPSSNDEGFDFGGVGSNSYENTIFGLLRRIEGDNYWGIRTYIGGGGTENWEDAPSNPSADAWYCCELVRDVTNGYSQLYVDDVLKVNVSKAHVGNNNIVFGGIDYANHAGLDVYFDSFTIADTYIGTGTEDTYAPNFGTITANSTLAGNGTQISCMLTDDSDVSAWGFAWNNTGVWVNSSYYAVSGSPVTALYNGTWNDTVGNAVQAQFWANDTLGNEAYSTIQTFTLTLYSSYSTTYMYRIFINSTSTYRLNVATGLVDDSGTPVSVINNAISNATGSICRNIFCYNGTYLVAGAINMRTNVNLVLQDQVNITETDTATNIFYWNNFVHVANNAWLIAEYNAVIKGVGATGTQDALMSRYNLGATSNDSVISYGQLEIWNIGGMWLQFQNAVNCTFQNLNGHHWMQSTAIGDNHGMCFGAGMQDCQIINVTSNGANSVHSRSTLLIGAADIYPVNNVNITGGVFEYSYSDNGIYLGGWESSLTNVRIENVTTNNNNIAHTGHSGLKLRPACNVTVINWTSNYDYCGIEISTTTNSESNTYLTGGSWYNNVSGTINFPYASAAVLDVDGSDKGQSVMYNIFNIAVNNGSLGGLWIDNDYLNDQVSYNTVSLNCTSAKRQAVDISGTAGFKSHNTFYLRLSKNGADGYCDLDVENTTSSTYNVFNVYSWANNPNGLYGFTNGTGNDYVYYPYIGGGAATVDTNIMSPTNTTYSSPTVSVELYASGGTIDTILWNCTHTNGTVAYANTVYAVPTSMTLGDGAYIFNARANNTLGVWDEATVTFTVAIVVAPTGPSGFNLYFPATTSLAFQVMPVTYQTDGGLVIITVNSGTLNGTSGTLTMYIGGGTLYFSSLGAANITLHSVSETFWFVNGVAAGNNEAYLILSGVAYTISWRISGAAVWLLPFTFIIGMVGLASSFAGPMYAIYKVKKGEYYEGMRMGVIITALGFALTIAWLWGG